MPKLRPTANRTQENALASLLAIAGRLTRESLSMRPPHEPLWPDGHGMAAVDHYDLTALGRAHREYMDTLSGTADLEADEEELQ